MIIKGLFRRYERWNHVHPTIGTFWGMGIGVGCGVGWGPGFGPEVIGYVGAGCGVGFSVGITLAGIGVGLPRNDLLQILYNATTTKAAPFDMAKSSTFIIMKGVTEDKRLAASKASISKLQVIESFERWNLKGKEDREKRKQKEKVKSFICAKEEKGKRWK
ncbi:hypothetical protein ZIOFF_007196 [Zingiber officinale]|uniref:Cadmium-induced protein AS8 n=1 Tax=Zingiber officinale TaxID=94328 RepID=A0A8J5IFR6_ZINOF|nr:hypothetical protein ZIOFF_007196 [Zingiber officinale]